MHDPALDDQAGRATRFQLCGVRGAETGVQTACMRSVIDQGRTLDEHRRRSGALSVERVTRIELALSAWEADVLPLNYTRGIAHAATREHYAAARSAAPAGVRQPESGVRLSGRRRTARLRSRHDPLGRHDPPAPRRGPTDRRARSRTSRSSPRASTCGWGRSSWSSATTRPRSSTPTTSRPISTSASGSARARRSSCTPGSSFSARRWRRSGCPTTSWRGSRARAASAASGC